MAEKNTKYSLKQMTTQNFVEHEEKKRVNKTMSLKIAGFFLFILPLQLDCSNDFR